MDGLAAFILATLPPLPLKLLPAIPDGVALAASLIVPVGGGILLSSAARDDVESAWYRSLRKPWWTPPVEWCW